MQMDISSDCHCFSFHRGQIWSVEQIRGQLETMIETKLLELTPEMITEMMDSVGTVQAAACACISANRPSAA